MRPVIISLIVFLLIFIGWRHLYSEGIILYQGIGIDFFVTAGLVIFLKINRKKSGLEIFKEALLAFFLIYGFVFTVPTTVDRAYSVRMINNLAAAQQGLSQDEITANYKHYFSYGGGVEKRIHEQIVTGTVEEQKGKFVLTRAGRLLAKIFRLVAVTFACSPQSDD